MKVKKYWVMAAVLVMCLAGVRAAKSFEELTEKQWSLAEIKALHVFVQGVTEETKKVGLRVEQIQADVEARLKQEGIRAVSEEEGLRLAGSPVLYVNISAHKRKEVPAFVYHVDVGVLQEVALVREPKIRTMSITWNKGRLGHCSTRGLARSVRETVEYLMDRFREDYAAANPKPEAVKKSS